MGVGWETVERLGCRTLRSGRSPTWTDIR